MSGEYQHPGGDLHSGWKGHDGFPVHRHGATVMEIELWPGPPGPHRAQRGSDVEAWIKRHRDKLPRVSESWADLDWLLDDYREHADTGTPLGAEVAHE